MATRTAASMVPFSHFCKLCDRISSAVKEKKKEQLIKFVDFYRNYLNDIKKDNPNATDSFFPVLRLLLPFLDRERGAYGIKELTLARLYTKILCLGENSADAKKLKYYRAPKNMKGQAGDFAEVAYFVLKNRCPKEGSMTVQEVNDELDALAENHAARNNEEVNRHLKGMLRNMSATEQKWLIRIIMKDMRIGMGQNSILNVYHPDAKDLYDVTSNLEKVCITLRNPAVRLHEVEISLFSPFRPMLADRGVLEKIDRQMQNKPYYIETKYDGERLQLHKDGNTYKYFTRNCFEYTDAYGASPTQGAFTPHIARCFDPSVQSCILDGEMLSWNKKTGCIVSKGENFDVKSLKEDSEYQACLTVFDILMKNGKVLTNLPLRERLKYQDKLFTPVKGRIGYTVREEANTKRDVVDALNKAIDKREEGLILKDPDSVYKPAARKGGWLKVKPEYTDSLMDQLDLIIMGGYFGGGRRGGLISHFLLGVAVPADSPGEHPHVFHSVCRVGSGYTFQELYELLQKLAPYWKPYKKGTSLPPELVWTREKPDLWLQPSNSQIVQVKAAEIVESDMYKTGCTLRFPRVEKVRYDKFWHECMTLPELEELRKQAEGKLASRHFMDEYDEEPTQKRRKVVQTEKPVLADHFKGADVSVIEKESEMLKEKEFCVINGPSGHSKQDLEKMVVKYGGTIVQNPGTNTLCILASKINLKVKNIIKYKVYDVVNAEWLLNCVKQQVFRQWTPADMLYTSVKTQENFLLDYDEFGDSYIEDATPQSLRLVFEAIAGRQITAALCQNEIADLEQDCFSTPNEYGLFRIFKFYLDKYENIGDVSSKLETSPLDVTELELRFWGGVVSSNLHEQITHVVMDAKHTDRMTVFRRINRDREKKFHIVSEEWVAKCILHKRLLNERTFEPD